MAERVKSWDIDGVVMTAEPVSVGAVFQVTVLEKVLGWLGSLVSVVSDLIEHLSPVSQQFTWKSWNKNYSDSSSKDPNYKGTSMWGFLSSRSVSSDIQIVEIHHMWLFQVFQVFHYSMKPRSQAFLPQKGKERLVTLGWGESCGLPLHHHCFPLGMVHFGAIIL